MVQIHEVRVYRSEEGLPKEDQLAWKLAQVASDPVDATLEATDMVINRIIDNAAVATASLTRAPVASARQQALSHPPSTGGSGATVFGMAASIRASVEWAAWANSVAVRELDYHDTFLAADYSHPGDNIPPIVAVTQHLAIQRKLSGRNLIRALLTGYEIQVNLAKAICLHCHRIDHVAHLGPSVAAGIGTLLGLGTNTIYQSIGQALHVNSATRQSRKGEISSWKAYAPAHAGKVAIEAVDRAMRGETSPTPIYEGEDAMIAWLLAGADARYEVPLPEPGEARLAILETYTKEHSAEYQAQALIDLARKLHHKHPAVADPAQVDRIVIRSSHHTHNVIGSGASDPQKYDPMATRETLDHSIPYIFAVALQDGSWHHVHSYAPERAQRFDTVALWGKISTEEDDEWTRRYHSPDPAVKAFGGSVRITMTDGTVIVDEIAVADANPLGARPFAREQYLSKFRTLTQGVLTAAEINRFLDLVQRLPELTPHELAGLTITAASDLTHSTTTRGLF